MSDTYARLMIEALPHGGYIIFPGQMYEGHYTPILTAKTTLDEALAFVRGAIMKPDEALENRTSGLADANSKSPIQAREE